MPDSLDKVRKMNSVHRLIYYMNERYQIRHRRVRLQLDREEWTGDPILKTYKFTNVRRDWDYTSAWLINNWYKPHWEAPQIGVACALARFTAHVPTLVAIGFPAASMSIPEWLRRTKERITMRAQRGQQVFTGAYVIAGGTSAGKRKTDWLIDDILMPVAETRVLRDTWKGSVLEMHERLREFNGWGDFMTQEVVLDLMHTRILAKCAPTEKLMYGLAGPGAIRGLNRVNNRPVTAHLNRDHARTEMIELWDELRSPYSHLHEALKADLTVHDVEFNLCEFDKYERALHGEGTPKQIYKPRETSDAGYGLL